MPCIPLAQYCLQLHINWRSHCYKCSFTSASNIQLNY